MDDQLSTAITKPNDLFEDASLALYEKAIMIRATEQSLLDLFKEGKTFGTVHTCIGQEFTGLAVSEYLLPGDTIFSNHRCHGHFLSRTGNVEGLLAELMGRSSGVSGGKGGSQHLCQDGFYSNGIQGGITPVSAGMAFAHNLNASNHIAVVFIGDGTLGEGVVYETLNLASKWKLPLLIVLEDNQYAQSTPSTQTLAGSVAGRAQAFNVAYETADVWDLPNLLETTKKSVDYVRAKTKPLLLHLHTYRLGAHSKGDDDRDVNEVNEYKSRDLLMLFELSQPTLFATFKAQAEEDIQAAILQAESMSPPGSRPFISTMQVQVTKPKWQVCQIKKEERVNALIYQALLEKMETDERIVLLGEDIESPYGGAFKVTRDLSERFPARVRNMPISEAAIIGMGNGLALQGYIPVCEIMFGDFMLLAADQLINHAAKFKYMYNDQVSVPLIVRTPMGGRRGYGPTHSQSLEKHFLGVPGMQVIALNMRVDPVLIYRELFSTIKDPTLVIENKLLYSKKVRPCELDGLLTLLSEEAFPTVRVTMGEDVETDITLFCYGGMLDEVEKAVHQLFEEEEIIAEIICPTLIYPLNVNALIESLEKSNRLLIIEEGQGFAALGAEVISQIVEHKSELLSNGVHRICAGRHPIPACGWLEDAALPQVEDIVNKAKEMVLE